MRRLINLSGCYSVLGMMMLLPTVGKATTLLQAIQAARQFDVEISAAHNAKLAGNESFNQGVAGMLPSINLDASYIKQDQPHAPYAAAVERHNYGVTLTQPLFDMSKIATLKRGEALSDISDVDYLMAEQEMILNVANAFFDVLYQRDVLRAAQSASHAFATQLDRAKTSLRLGDSTKTDLDEAQAEYDEAMANEINARNALEVASGAYYRLTGLRADDVAAIGDSCLRLDVPSHLKQVMAVAVNNNLMLRKAQLQVEQSDSDVLAAGGSHLPVVSFQASYGGNWSRGEDENILDNVFGTTQKTRNTMVGVNISVPIFAGGGQLSQTREALRRRDQARDELENMRRKVIQDTRTAYLGITNGLALFNAQKKSVHSAKNKVKSTRYGREVGLRTVVDELNAIQALYGAVRRLTEARYNFLSSKIQLLQLLNQLNEGTLAEFGCQIGALRKSPNNAMDA